MKKLTNAQFTEKSISIHGDKYNYSLVNYVNCNTGVTIICKEHGDFLQSPSSHLSGSGCPYCAKENKTKTTHIFIQRALELHGTKYDYSLVEYTGTYSPITIICKEHGAFSQRPYAHLNGQGCRNCGYELLSSNQLSTTSDFITKAQKLNGTRYNYTLVNYIGNKKKVKIICSLHGEFLQTPNGHLNGQNCPSCSTGGFNSIQPAILYYIKFEYADTTLYKVGITNIDTASRIRSMYLNNSWTYTILNETHFTNGSDAHKKEKSIHHKFKRYQYKGEPIMQNGFTELFIIDILGLDSQPVMKIEGTSNEVLSSSSAA